MVNSVTLVGRAVADPELKHFNSGAKVVELRIAVDAGKDKDTGKRKSDFFKVKFWNKAAEIAAEHVKKGHRFGVVGQLTVETWERNGQKREKVIVNGNHLTLLQDKDKSEDAQDAAAKPADDDDIFGFVSDDDIPF